MTRSLPPFPALQAFLAVARTGGIRSAGRELNVTDSAVSHQLRKLEDHLGAPVLERSGRGVRLTAIGRQYAAALEAPLRQIADATDQLFGLRNETDVTLTTAPVVASLALIPNLPQLEAAHPKLILHLVTTPRQLDLDANGIDLALRYEASTPAASDDPLIFPEYAFPVCAPSIVGQKPYDALRKRRLLNAAHPEDWEKWEREAGQNHASTEPSMRFDSSEMTLGAAAQGMGIAIGRTPLVNEHLASGRLVAPFGTGAFGEGSYRIIPSPRVGNRGSRAAVIDWLRDILSQP
ncbi:LysR family transcriptional regulator [Salipiger abyssi]|uniref:LysR family transcriptional regulator n=1 Tax=Salipiger abyssi TaxID=1250539 RepID=UPI000976C425|nr:LysR family transcriptional regulator [Salipiger abyssi]